MDAIQTGQAPGNVTEDMTTKLQAAGITVTASSNTVSIAADTTVTISGDITFELNKQTYKEYISHFSKNEDYYTYYSFKYDKMITKKFFKYFLKLLDKIAKILYYNNMSKCNDGK